METGLIPLPAAHLIPATFRQEVEAAQTYAGHAKAENTLRAYKSDWTDFTAYCAARSLFLSAG